MHKSEFAGEQFRALKVAVRAVRLGRGTVRFTSRRDSKNAQPIIGIAREERE
jgi:hypothetical protein